MWFVKWKTIFKLDPTKPAEDIIFTSRNSTSYETVSYSSMDILPGLIADISDRKMNYNKHLDGKIAKAYLQFS